MKTPDFDHLEASSVEAAVALLAARPQARLLAGGQSLIPMLAERRIAPEALVDLNGIAALAGVAERDGTLVIGSMTRQREIETSPLILRRAPLLSEAVGFVGHRATRNRGTVGGSLAQRDPTAELPTAALALDAEIAVAGPAGPRTLAVAELLAAGDPPPVSRAEVICEIRIAPWAPGHGWAFLEVARRHGAPTILAVAALLEIAGGAVVRSALAVAGLGGAPARVGEAEALLAGRPARPETVDAAAAVCGGLPARDDIDAPAGYRRRLAVTLAARALRLAAARARPVGP